MTANVFEESTLTLSAWIARGKGDRANAKFEFEQEGGAETIEAAELELGGKEGGKKKVSTQITLPKCKDDEDFYTLSYKVTCGGVEYPGNDFKVWLKTAKFKAVDSDGAALKGVPITFNQTKEKIYVTDSSGEVPLPINATAPGAVTVRSPCSVDEWVTDVGRLREAKVTKKEYKAVIVDPDPEGKTDSAPLKQFVNLPVDASAPRQGSKIKIAVGGATDTECIPGIPGDPFYVKVEVDLTKASKRNSPKRAVIIDGTTVELDANGKAEGEGKFDEKGEASFEVELGLAGGDLTKIQTGITKACEDSTLYVQNWRRLWYQLTIPEGTTEPDMSHSVTALEEVFIEYIQEGETVTIAKGTGPAGKLSWFDAGWIGGTAGEQVLNIGNHNRDFYHALLDNKHSPLQTHVLCCNTQYDPAGSNTEKQFLGLEVTPSTKVTWSDGSQVVGIKQLVGHGFFPKKLLDGTSSIISGTWKASDNSENGNITDADVHIENWSFTVKLPAAALTYLAKDAANKVKVSMKLFKAKGPYNGESAKHKQLLRIGRADEEVNKTLCHELGHSLHQVPQSAGAKPPGLGAVTHGREYTRNGHSGGHCADGMSDDNYNGGAGKAGTSYAGNFKGKAECTCLMYGEGSSTRGNKYCSRCKPFIIAEAVASVEA